ncbi:MAG: glycosyltransferase, partial [Candidatus Muiribacteriota bacterium]
GNPVRERVKKHYYKALQQDKKKDGEPVLFITGGANGVSRFNSFVCENIEWLTDNFFVYHQYGKNEDNINNFEEKLRGFNYEKYVCKRFFSPEELAEIYALNPVLLARAGAGTIADIINFKMSAVLMPLPGSAGGEQLSNANMLVKTKAAFLLKEEDKLNHSIIKQTLLNAFVQSNKVKENLKKHKGTNYSLINEILDLYL